MQYRRYQEKKTSPLQKNPKQNKAKPTNKQNKTEQPIHLKKKKYIQRRYKIIISFIYFFIRKVFMPILK